MSAVSVSALALQWSAGSRPGATGALAELIRLCHWNKDVGDIASPRPVERPISMHPLGG